MFVAALLVTVFVYAREKKPILNNTGKDLACQENKNNNQFSAFNLNLLLMNMYTMLWLKLWFIKEKKKKRNLRQ